MNDRAKFDDPPLESLLPKVPFTRRGFIASSVATGFALAAGPLAAQTAIITPADGLEVGSAQVPVSGGNLRSEEHTSELQSLRHLVCRLLLEKKKKHLRKTECRPSIRL